MSKSKVVQYLNRKTVYVVMNADDYDEINSHEFKLALERLHPDTNIVMLFYSGINKVRRGIPTSPTKVIDDNISIFKPGSTLYASGGSMSMVTRAINAHSDEYTLNLKMYCVGISKRHPNGFRIDI